VAAGLLASRLFFSVVTPTVHLGKLLTGWQTSTLSIVVLALDVCLAGAYLEGVRRLSAKGRQWSRWRTASFLGGSVVVVVAFNSGVAGYATSIFYVRAVQHVLYMNAAPILWALGAPMTLWLQASGQSLQKFLLRVLHSKTFEVLTFPALVAALSYALMLVYFLSSFYTFSEQHPVVLGVTNVVFLLAGSLYWWPVVGLDPSRWRLSFPARLGYLATGIPVTTFLGLGLVSSRYSIDPAIYTLSGTQSGGGALWVLSELFTLVAMGCVLLQLMHTEERAAARYDRRLMHEEANLEREALLAEEREALLAEERAPRGA
jgi:cytochrome c oxidase assembly factor CtaG